MRTKTLYIGIKVSPDEKRRIRKLAKFSKLSVSELIRSVVLVVPNGK